MVKRNKKIIIIDDNLLSVEGICHGIDWASIPAIVCATFYDAKSAMEYIDQNSVDIVITDVRMPGMTGLEMAHHILQKKTFLKIIFISAYDDFHYVQEALRVGAFDYIEKPISYNLLLKILKKASDVIEQEQMIIEELTRNRPALIQNFFSDLIHSTPEDAAYLLAQNLTYLDLNLDYECYVCTITRIENATEIKHRLSIEQYYLMERKLRERISKANDWLFPVYFFLEHDNLITIWGFCLPPQKDVFVYLHQMFSSIVSEMYDYPLRFSVGIGKTVPTLWQVSASYKNASQLLEFRFFFSHKHVFLPTDQLQQNPYLLFDQVFEDQLLAAISQKKLSEIQRLIHQFSEQITNGNVDKSTVFVYVYSVIGKLLNFFGSVGAECTELKNMLLSASEAMEVFPSSEALFQWLFEFCSVACNCLERSVESYHLQLCNDVKRYIQENYCDPNLSLNTIAVFVNISGSYLSSLFKKNTGKNITDQITETRIRIAQELLQNTILSIKEISERVGYSNQYYFSASFKKITGLSPSAFRADT